jgi:hypothetical protein
MALKIRFRFNGKCVQHPRYDPNRDGRPQHRNCEGCETLFVIDLYTRIAKKRADKGAGIVVRTPTHQEEQPGANDVEQSSDSDNP